MGGNKIRKGIFITIAGVILCSVLFSIAFSADIWTECGQKIKKYSSQKTIEL